MTPLERIRANPLPFADLLGVEFVSAEPDRIVARMRVAPEHCTLGARVHGGAVMALADTMGGVAAFINLAAESSGTTTIESKTNFVGVVRAGDTARATCEPVHIGRTTMVWQTRITRGDGKLAAVVTQTQLVLKP